MKKPSRVHGHGLGEGDEQTAKIGSHNEPRRPAQAPPPKNTPPWRTDAEALVTPEQAAAAKQGLLIRAQRAAARAAKPSPPPPAPAPRRIGLTDLKLAAERRKAAAS